MSSIGRFGEGTTNPIVALPRRAVINLITWTATLAGASRRNGPLLPWQPSRLAIGTTLALIVVAIPMLLIDTGAIGIEKRLPAWFVFAFDEITDFGKSGWVLWPTGILLLVIAAVGSPALGRIGNMVVVSLAVRVGFVFLAVGIPSLVVTIVKRLIGRSRPPRIYPTGPFDYFPFSWRVENASMPSGHGTTAFAIAVALGALFPRARVVLWIYAALIAISRVVIAAHYPSDVVAGAIVGGIGALVVRWWFAVRRLGFIIGADGSIRAMPGPSWRRLKIVAARLLGQ